MSDPNGTEYVVKQDKQYLQDVSSGSGYVWSHCQMCAMKFDRLEAHVRAHGSGSHYRVVRLVKKKGQPSS